VIATGSQIQPQEVKGLLGQGWRTNIFDFYTPDGAVALRKFFQTWQGGRLALNVAEVPIKCPVAPLEFLFLADWYFTKRGMRDKVELVYSTPLSGVVSKISAAEPLQQLLESKGESVELEFFLMQVDGEHNLIRSYDGRQIEYDLLVSVPTNMGASMLSQSGIGNEFRFVPADSRTLQNRDWENVWVIGDAAGIPTPKVGSAAHLMANALAENLVRIDQGLPPQDVYDGRTTCVMESGYNKGVVLSFDYEHDPAPGKFPLPGIGPLSSLRESSFNFIAKRSFLWFYWNLVLKHGYVPFL
jgi:sulfide:quinone oxidoreductase